VSAKHFTLAPSQRFAVKPSRSTSIPPGEPFPQECFDITRVPPLDSELCDRRLLDCWLLDNPLLNAWLLLLTWLLNKGLPNNRGLPNTALPNNRALLKLAPALASTEQAAWAEVMSLEVVSPDIVGRELQTRESPSILERGASMDVF
jgi:hypothetical protein